MSIGARRRVAGSIDRLYRFGTTAALGDGQLLERFATRHDEAAEAAFAAIVERHGPMVLRVCRGVLNDPHEAQDAFQATFLVLMRKARSVRRRESLGSWLYGVARRVAARSLQQSARRRTVERSASAGRSEVDPSAAEPVDRAVWDEVDRLPHALREVIVACYLEGLTHEQAAARLGWPVGTVRSRLARGRDRLRVRLTRRGLAPAGIDREPTPDAAAGLALLFRPLPSPALPAWLIDSTARAALRLAIPDAAATGLVSGTAAALSQGVLPTMFLAQIKMAGLALAATGALAAGAVVSTHPAILDDADETKPTPPARARQDEATTRRQDELRQQIRDLERQVERMRAEAERAAGEARTAHGRAEEARDRAEGDRERAESRRREVETRRAERARATEGSPDVAPDAPPVPPQPPRPPQPPVPPQPPMEPRAPVVQAGQQAERVPLRSSDLAPGGPDTERLERRLDALERRLNQVLDALERRGEAISAPSRPRDERPVSR